jgi:hypothetical protein
MVLACAAALCVSRMQGQSSRGTSLALTVAPECSIGVVSVATGAPNSQTIKFNYKLRTSDTGGQGQIMLRLTTSGIANVPSSSTLDYQASLAGPGTPSSGSAATQEALNSGIVIARFGPQAHSTRSGAVGTVQLTVTEPLRPSLSISCQ